MNKKVFYQQGDVIIKRIVTIPRGERLSHLTLAKGEATGHHHTITEGDASLHEREGTLYLKVESENAILTHQEHNPITIEKGDYQIGIVKEYDHLLQEERNVAD